MDWLAVYAAILSTLLGTLRFGEWWRDRFRIEIAALLRDCPSEGNEIHVRNLAARPIIVTHWQLYWISGRWPFRSKTGIQAQEYDSPDIRIDARSTRTLDFRDEDHFDWGATAARGRQLYFRLHFAGHRRPVVRRIYGERP